MDADKVPLRVALAGQSASSVFAGLALVEVEAGYREADVLARLQGDPTVATIEPNYRLRILENAPEPRYPNDFDFGQLWNLKNTGQNGGTAGADIHAPEAWAITTGDPGLRVAVIDTGIDYFHPDLAANVWVNPGEIPGNGLDDDHNGYVDDVHGYDFVSDDSDPMDDQIHGTHVAGIIGAVGNNSIGVAGVCWQTQLMALKAFDENGEATLFQVIEALRYAIANGARVINASWGQPDRSRILAEAIAESHEAGLIIAAAAGNSRTDRPTYPAAYPEAVTAAASNNQDQRSFFSNYGDYVDVAAPGDLIYSTVPNNRHEYASGTSMATPHVSGVAALILSVHPTFTNTEVEDILRSTTDPVAAREYIGMGRLNAARALSVTVPLPVARLQIPKLVSGRVDIRGTAAGPRFREYRLEYGQGVYPSEWTLLYTGQRPVDQAVLMSGFLTPTLAEGDYVLRLTVFDQLGQAATDRANFTVRNVNLASPSPNDILRAGDLVTLRGTCFGTGRTFTIEYGSGWMPGRWSTEGIVLVDDGQTEVLDGVLGSWDTRSALPNEFYTLRLTAWVHGRKAGESRIPFVHLDGRLRPGWPQWVPTGREYSTNDWRQVTAADLDADGRLEVICLVAGAADGTPADLRVFDLSGQIRWTRSIPAATAEASVLTTGDLDGDGLPEILAQAGDDGAIWGFHGDGSVYPGFSPLALGLSAVGVTLADLDQDGKVEMIALGRRVTAGGAGPRELQVRDREGQLRQRWVLGDWAIDMDVPPPFAAVGDLDEDPELEIVCATACDTLGLFDLTKTSGPVWTANVQGCIYGSPVVGDVDGDQRVDVVVGVYDHKSGGKAGTRGGVHALDRRGQPLPGWPVLIDRSFASTPVLANLNEVLGLEIVIPCWGDKRIYALRADGFALAGWPSAPLQFGNLKTPSVVVGDVDGDGKPDVVAAAPGHASYAVITGELGSFGGIRAWNSAGQVIDLHPRPDVTALVMDSGRTRWGVPVLADADGDGTMDLVAGTVDDIAYFEDVSRTEPKNRFGLYVWSLDGVAVPAERSWPMLQRDPERTGYVPTRKPVNQPPNVRPIPSQRIPLGGRFFEIQLDRYVDDPDHAPSQMTWRVEGAVALRVTMSTNRVVTVATPTPSWLGEETLQFVVRDPGGLEATGSASFSVLADYQPPVAVPDHGVVAEDQTVQLAVLANDWHPRGYPLELRDWERPASGTVTRAANGNLVYQPNADFFGEDSFHYVVGDGQGGFTLGQVTIQVLPVPDPPKAVTDWVMAIEDVPVEFDVLANDFDPDGETLRLLDFTQPDYGTVTLTASGTLSYLGSTNWSGTDGFTYRVVDPTGLVGVGQVVLQVKPVDDPPSAGDLAFSLNRNTKQEITYLGDDPEGAELSFRVLSGPEHGELWSYPKVATYYPKKGFVGTDRFTYEASDGENRSAPAQVTLTVLDRNNPPTVDSQSLTNKVGRPLTIRLSASDPDDDPLTFSVTTRPAHGTLSGEGPGYLYTPDAQFLGEDTFTVRVSDGQAVSAEGAVRVRMTDLNTAPIALAGSVEVPANLATSLSLGGLDNENDPLSFLVVTNPVHGVLSGQPPNLVYTPAPNYFGPDRLAFTASDGEATSVPAIVSLSVVFPNQVPDIKDQWVTLTAGQPTPVTLVVTDADGDRLRAVILKGPRNGRLYGEGTNYVYVPKTGYVGTDSFTCRVWDGTAYSQMVTVSLSIDAPPPAQPTRFIAIKVSEEGRVSLRLRTEPGKTVRIERSSDLNHWTTEAEFLPTAAELDYSVSEAASEREFYRALRP